MTTCNPWELREWQKAKKLKEAEQSLKGVQNWQPSERAVYAEHVYKAQETERLQREIKQIKEGRR